MRKQRLEIEQVSSVDLAAEYADRLVKREARGPGDVEEAMHRIEARFGVPYSTLWGLRYRKPKTIAADLFLRIRGAYLAMCERELRKLEHDLAVASATGGGDDYQDLVDEADRLAAKLKAAASRLKGGAL
jgi:hypothetical protein